MLSLFTFCYKLYSCSCNQVKHFTTALKKAHCRTIHPYTAATSERCVIKELDHGFYGQHASLHATASKLEQQSGHFTALIALSFEYPSILPQSSLYPWGASVASRKSTWRATPACLSKVEDILRELFSCLNQRVLYGIWLPTIGSGFKTPYPTCSPSSYTSFSTMSRGRKDPLTK